jgi:iron complex outermembrane receptor protein
MTQDELQAAAPSTLAAGLQTLPSIVPGGGPTAGGGTGNGGQNFLNLRGLGNGRTLTLLDGRRFTSANPSGLVDTNLIPQGLVERVEVVTGGASAAYGSDAVGGVVNFILDKDFTGIKTNVSAGQSQRGDNEELKVSLTLGTDYAGGRGHFIASGEFYTNHGVDGSARSWRRKAPNMLANPDPTGPRLVTGTDLRTPYTPGSVIVTGVGGTAANNAVFQGIQFGPSGVPIPYDYGTISTTRGNANGTQNGGDGFRVSTGQEIVRPLDRSTIFARTDFHIADPIGFFAEFVYGDTESAFQSSPITRTFTVQRDNAFLALAAPSIVEQMIALDVPRLSVNRLTTEAGVSLNVNLNKTTRYLAGFDGDIGGWHWEVSYQQGENRNRNYMDPNLILSNFALAVDAVFDPQSGAIVCRSTLTNPNNGCVPFNPFGVGAPSPAAIDYVAGRSHFTTVTKQEVAAAYISGELFELSAGPVVVATGGEYRKEKATTVADPLSNAGAFRLVNQQDFYGSYHIKEFFAEAQVPLLSDLPLVQDLAINLAGRRTDYSTSGSVETWKAGLTWQFIDDLRLRATYSRDIRAPNLLELYATGRQNNITVEDSLTNRSYFSVPNRTFGNLDLKPEEATTRVIGFVYQPSWLPGFNLAVDYWSIEIDDAISNIGGNDAVQQCYLSNQTSPICAFVERDPVTLAVLSTRTSPANLTQERTHGYDIEASYRLPVNGGTAGELSFRLIAGYVGERIELSPLIAVPIDDAGNSDAGLPNWRGTLSTTYSIGDWSVLLQTRYIGSMTWDRTRNELGVDTDFNHVDSTVYMDGQLRFEPSWGNGRQTYYLNIQNILDREPRFAPRTGGATPLPTIPSLYDEVGRMFRLGVRFQF